MTGVTNQSPADGAHRTPAVEVAELAKRYPKAPVDSLAGVSFQVEEGEVFGFLGPNGAGKSTTIGILTTRIRPTRGRALVAGVDVVADPVSARRVLGVVPQQNNLEYRPENGSVGPTPSSSSSAWPTGPMDDPTTSRAVRSSE